jgi:thymidylate synthase
MKVYHELLKDILENGEQKDDRTGVGTLSLFARQLRFNLNDGFPAITTKKLAWKACVGELLWFLEGSNDERRLAEITYGASEGKVTIWTPNAMAPYWKDKAEFEGDLGRVYGVQWRRWRKHDVQCDFGKAWNADADRVATNMSEIDQVKNLIDGLKNEPHSRRHILSAWNVSEFDEMALPPCHVMSQYYVNKNNELSCHMYQRSVDVFLGLPFNIASYALLTNMLAQVCGLKVGELVISTGDTHVYNDHIEQVKEQLSRTEYVLPKLYLNPDIKDIDKFTMDDIKLVGYQSHGQIKANMAV